LSVTVAHSDGKHRGFTAWLDHNGGALATRSAEIVAILVAALLVRALLVRAIHRIVAHAAESKRESRTGRLFEGGLLLATERRKQRTHTLGSVLRSLTSTLIFVIAMLMIISVLRIPTAPILASISVVGFAVGFGARNLVTDFVAGVSMILEDQYGVGDVIDAGAATGTVEEVGLRVTRLRDADGVVWYLRNGNIDRIGNKSQGFGRAVVDVPVAYDEDMAAARQVLEEVASGLYAEDEWREQYLDEEPQVTGIEVLDGAAVVLRVQARTPPQRQQPVERELRARLKSALDEAGVVVASTRTDGSPTKPDRPSAKSGGSPATPDSSTLS
jgi:small-conductance mechanosensitive channel